MGFNYGLEKRKFTEEWKKLYREYKAAGMSEEDIQDIYAFDLNVFRKTGRSSSAHSPSQKVPVTTEPNRVNLCLPY